MHISRRISLIVGVVIVAAAIAGVTFAQADKTGRPSAAAALAHTKQLSEQLAHMPKVRPHHRSHRLTQRAAHSGVPRAHSAQIDAALKNAANVAGAYALPASPSSGTAAAAPATLPAQVVAAVQKTVVSDALDSSGVESNNSTYSSGGTETVVEVSGTFAPPTAPPPPAGGTAYTPKPAKYLIVVTDDATGDVRGVGLGNTPIPLTQMSASVTDATVPQP